MQVTSDVKEYQNKTVSISLDAHFKIECSKQFIMQTTQKLKQRSYLIKMFKYLMYKYVPCTVTITRPVQIFIILFSVRPT